VRRGRRSSLLPSIMAWRRGEEVCPRPPRLIRPWRPRCLEDLCLGALRLWLCRAPCLACY
jgi:hypothetical protein